MGLRAVSTLASFFCVCNAIPIFRPGLGVFTSTSTEVIRPNILTLPNVAFGQPQIVNFNPQLPGNPFLFPQQEIFPMNPNAPIAPINPALYNLPMQVPQNQGPQGFPYFMNYPQQKPPMVMPPNQNTAQQNMERATQGSQTPMQNQARDVWTMSPPPDNRGDTAGAAIEEGYPSFSFMP
ncbi:alpha/beta-gliadin A-V-like [Denticeps clupeoides]|uniref:alpha/beta-gliadin A-V-like n=1 Tax=Denticeps clupeoides TaxID=299321 RepID=UPI0010A4AEFC|nr:alpha/beta-gliadin A-V-like [Denticeps clupeoides]